MFTNKPMIIYFVRMNDEVVYIGQTKLSLEKRRKQHEYNASRGKGYIIGAALRKHGATEFVWNVHSVYFNQIDLDAAEKHYIAKYSPKYNINLGGESRGVRKNKGSTPWNKDKKGMQEAWNKGRKETRLDVLEKISNSAKLRDNKGRTISQSQRSAMIEGRREAYKISQKAFICHETNKTYILVVDAAKDLGISANGIYAVLSPDSRLKSYKGFSFSYIQQVRAA